jgi:hypothetical protein
MMNARLDERAAAMKIVVNWFLLGVFTLQATGATWYAHLSECCCEPEKVATCQCGHCRCAAAHGFAWEDFRTLHRHPASGGNPIHHRHDSQTCSICQLLLTLAATTEVPQALPAIHEVTFEQPAPSERPLADTFLSTLDARGPPACTL